MVDQEIPLRRIYDEKLQAGWDVYWLWSLRFRPRSLSNGNIGITDFIPVQQPGILSLAHSELGRRTGASSLPLLIEKGLRRVKSPTAQS